MSEHVQCQGTCSVRARAVSKNNYSLHIHCIQRRIQNSHKRGSFHPQHSLLLTHFSIVHREGGGVGGGGRGEFFWAQRDPLPLKDYCLAHGYLNMQAAANLHSAEAGCTFTCTGSQDSGHVHRPSRQGKLITS